ncbi:MAG: PH domain-containing protein [Planctomycetota bacterium]
MTETTHEPSDESSQPSGGASTESTASNLAATEVATEVLAGPQRLHPSSIIFGVLKYLRQFVVAIFFALFLASSGNKIGAWLATIALLPAAIKSIIDYFLLRFEIVDGELRVHEGWLMKRDRAVPIERIQNLDLVQNPLHRLLGVAGVRVETASGKEPEAVLNVLRLDDIARLRASLFGRENAAQNAALSAASARTTSIDASALGENTEPGAASSASSSEHQHADVVLTASPARLAAYGMVSFRGLVAVPILFGLYFQFQPGQWYDFDRLRRFLPDFSGLQLSWLMGVALTVGALLAIAVASAIWFVTRFYGYQLRRNGDDLQISFGLFTRVSATVPRHRIQFISVQQNLWAKRLGLSNIRIETAGGASGEGVNPAASVARRWFIPVVPTHDVPRILNQLRDDLGDHWDSIPWQGTSSKTLKRLLIIAGLESLVLGAIGLAMYRPWGFLIGVAAFALLAFRAIRYSRSLRVYCGEDRIAYRQGLWTRRCSVTFADKLQTLQIKQSPFDRRWGMATLFVDTAGAGPAEHKLNMVYLDQTFAFDAQQRIASKATRVGFSG